MLTRPISISRQTFALVKIVIGFFNANIQEAVTIRAVKGRDDGLAIDSHRAAREDFLFLLLPYLRIKEEKFFSVKEEMTSGVGEEIASLPWCSPLLEEAECVERRRKTKVWHSAPPTFLLAHSARERERERERDTRNGGSRLSISLPTNPSSPTQYCIVLVNDFLFPIRSEQHLNQLPANKSRLRELITFDFRGNLAILLLFPIYSRMSCARSCVIK